MADVKFSELTELAEGSVASADILAIVDSYLDLEFGCHLNQQELHQYN